MKNRSCPNKDACWDYDASNCEGCAIGEKIARRVRQNKKLKAENAELHARLDKAVILPYIHKFYIRDIKGNMVMLYQIVYIDDDNAISTELVNSEERAEARLAELKGGEGE